MVVVSVLVEEENEVVGEVSVLVEEVSVPVVVERKLDVGVI